MKKNIFILAGAALCLGLSSCGKDFLEMNPTDQISNKRIEELSKQTPSVGAEMQKALLTGMYSWMYTPGAGGTRGDADFGQKSIDLYLDILSGDMVKAANDYGWLGDLQRRIDTQDKTRNTNYMPWRYFYRIIFTANSLIESAGGEADKYEDKELRHLVGQALGMRGYAYFYLTQIFAAEYTPEAKLVPIYTDTKTVDHTVALQKEVYAQAISDLSKAISFLNDFESPGLYAMSSNVAKCYLAYTYAAMGNYKDAEKLSKEVMSAGYKPMGPLDIVYNKTTGGTGFNSVNIPGWIWGTDMTSDMGIDLYSWYGQVDIFTYSYAVAGEPKVIDNVLYNAMKADDIRRGQFIEYDFPLTPANKFYPPVRKAGAQRNIDADYLYLRVSEMYMLHIESLARLKQEDAAKSELKAFLKGRIGDLSYIDGLSGQALLDEIYFQTRIEFWGEGKSYLALKRFKPAVIQFGDNRFDVEWQNKSIAYNHPSMFFKIPENEELNNPFLYVSKGK